MIQASTPKLLPADIELAADALAHSYGPNRMRYTDRFARELSEFYGNREVVFFSHCTNAMLTALVTLKRMHPLRNEVIVPALSWVSSASVVVNAGLKPIFVDVDIKTACLDTSKIEDLICSKTLAVMSVDLLGNMVDYSELKKILNNAPEVFLLQDSAEAFGANLYADDCPSGHAGDISFLSFHATKIVNCGQGGAAIVKDQELARQMKIIGHHGIDTAATGKYYWSNELGMNFSWSEAQRLWQQANLADWTN